ncbi:uncharacterized protein LOC113227355 [Hyposmocoma kahamanoa]|uniref:uncharacterized protein LOC113227355 n=1 Tax=Hyposmocoma kahamanoa TaxID=1477025 RepID=UPI000E6DA414|nr:uncharacterized protein LOC113227355 [Hyposmocoma kahamanoa]
MKLHDAQFGFKPGLSTESAIYCLKHTIRYYTDRRTPVFACFLEENCFRDYSINRTPVAVKVLVRKPVECREMGKQFFECVQVVQRGEAGGLTSPKLFNLYINGLIEQLSGARVGCSIGGRVINNISYTDDMVLLSPSVRALRRLLKICEQYAVAHELRYNAKKSELLVFKAGTKTYNTVPPITLDGAPLKQVKQFKYLGHWVTDALTDNLELDRERRALTGNEKLEIVDQYVYLGHVLSFGKKYQPKEISKIIQLGWAAFGTLDDILKSDKAPQCLYTEHPLV